jgi:hypothetical protein
MLQKHLFACISKPTSVVFRCHKSSQVYKFVDDIEILVAKSHGLSKVYEEMMRCDVKFVAFFQNLSQSKQLVCC